jgi:hypothetical protein
MPVVMNDEVIKFLAEQHWKKEELPDWAIRCLESGYDSNSLRILASMLKRDSASELDYYFQRSLNELGWNKIEAPDYLMKYAKILAREIVEEKTAPLEACRIIYKILVDLDYPPELHAWFEIDEMIYAQEYFVKTGVQSFYYLPEEQLISEIKKASGELLNLEKK